MTKKRPKTAIILGAPRSGTSMTAGILVTLGVSMGNVRKPDALNPQGYFEDRDFLALGDAIFRAADPECHGFHPPARSALRTLPGRFDQQIKDLVTDRERNCNGGAWGWKTTQTSFLADLFLPHLADPHFVVVLRNPLHSAASAVRYTQHEVKKHMYEELTLAQALQTVGRYEESIYGLLVRHAAVPRLVLAYEDIVAEPTYAGRLLASFLSLPVDSSALADVVTFVSSGTKERRNHWRDRLPRILRQAIRT